MYSNPARCAELGLKAAAVQQQLVTTTVTPILLAIVLMFQVIRSQRQGRPLHERSRPLLLPLLLVTTHPVEP